MAWNAANPTNDELLINFPAQQRANNEALALGTDAALLITNAKVSASAGIVDTKLAQITTAAKVSGAALTLLVNVPAGAGVLPVANSPNKLKADASDTTPQYLDGLIDANMFQVSVGDLLQIKDGGVETKKLENGSAAPGNSKYYGTNAGGTKGFFDLSPAFPSGGILLWSGAVGSIPAGFVICDGANSTPNLTDRFVIHADNDSGGTRNVGDTGGEHTHALSIAELASHTHTMQYLYRGNDGPMTCGAPYGTTVKNVPTSWTNQSGYFRNTDTGSGTAHQNMPKFYALAYIMKT